MAAQRSGGAIDLRKALTSILQNPGGSRWSTAITLGVGESEAAVVGVPVFIDLLNILVPRAHCRHGEERDYGRNGS